MLEGQLSHSQLFVDKDDNHCTTQKQQHCHNIQNPLINDDKANSASKCHNKFHN